MSTNMNAPSLACLLLAIAVLFSSCSEDPEAVSHQKMLSLLQQSAELFEDGENLFANEARIAYYDSLIALDNRFRYYYRYQQAIDRLRNGENEAAAAEFEALGELPPEALAASGLQAADMAGLPNRAALCYLRLGEQENCIRNHTAASCLIPIRPQGFHELPKGSAVAIEHYTRILERDTTDLSARWLLNIAHMTLGQYPEAAFASEYPMKPFPDRAGDIGFDIRGLSGGLIVDDFNNDGHLDLFLSEWGIRDPLRFYVNNGDGTFTERAKAAGLQGITGGLNLIQADYNNDGYLDVLILRGGWMREFGRQPNSLLKNNGDGTFTDVTFAAGLMSLHPTQTATWADFNNDGHLDLFIGNESMGASSFHFSELFLNQGDGTFKDVAEAAGVQVNKIGFRPSHHYIKGVTSADFDRDGWMDLYVSTGGLEQSRNFYFRNTGLNKKGIPVFEDLTEQAGLGGDVSTFTTWAWDYDNDGWTDIFASGYRRSNGQGSITTDICAEYLGRPHGAETGHLYRNNGDGTFTEVSEAVGLDRIMYSMGANFGDYDNDGWLDFYLGTGNIGMNSLIPNKAFRNAGGQRFQDVTTAMGVGHLQKGHGVSFADLDNDGDQDLLMSMGGAFQGDVFQNAFFENPYSGTPEAGNWLTVHLVGEEANRSAIGSTLKLVVEENGQEREIHRTVTWGGSFGSNPLRQQIGLGKATEVRELHIRWAGSGTEQTFQNLQGNRFIKITEGNATIEALTLKPLVFPKKDGSAHDHHDM